MRSPIIQCLQQQQQGADGNRKCAGVSEKEPVNVAVDGEAEATKDGGFERHGTGLAWGIAADAADWIVSRKSRSVNWRT